MAFVLPVPWAGLALLAGTLCLHRLPTLPPQPLATGMLVGAVLVRLALLRLPPRAGLSQATLVLLAWTVAGFAWAALHGHARLAERLDPAWEDREVLVVGVVDDLPTLHEDGSAGFRFHIERALFPSEACLPPRVRLSWRPREPGARPPAAGERWRFTVRLRRPHATVNAHAFDAELRLTEEGIGATGSVRPKVSEPERLDALAATPAAWLAAARAALRDGLLAATAGRAGQPDGRGMLLALTVGEQSALPSELWQAFNRTGIGHLMSISGLHITMLAALGGGVAGRLWRTRTVARTGLARRVPMHRARILAAVAVAGGYSLLAGWGIPAQRTFWMVAAAGCARLGGRAASMPAALSVALVAIVALDPLAPLAAGFWLSFCAVAALVWMGEGSAPQGGDRIARLRAFLASAVASQWAATVSLLPLSVLFFGAISLVGPLANAVAIPLVSGLLTPAVLAGAALGVVSPMVAGWLLVPCVWLGQGLSDAARWLSAHAWAAVELPEPGAIALVLATVGVVWALAPPAVPLRTLALFTLLPLLAPASARPAAGELRLTAFDVGQGTAVLLETERHALLVDTGPPVGRSDMAARVLVPWLRARGVVLDGLVVSHDDADHDGGTATLLAARPVGWLLGETRVPDDGRGPRRIACIRGDGWHWDGITFDVLHPGDEPVGPGSASNARSCTLHVRAPGGSVLLPGDIEAAQEKRLVERYGAALHADLLLAPHHGSRTSSTEVFLDAVIPQAAIFQQGWHGQHGHPHPLVAARYVSRGIATWRSDRDGAVTVLMRPDRPPDFAGERHARPRWWRVPWSDEHDLHPPRPKRNGVNLKSHKKSNVNFNEHHR